LTSKKVFFASDTHFGFPDFDKSLKREILFVKWLDEIKEEAKELYLLGDIFDFWFEYKRVVPRGYSRLLGKLSEFNDSGIPVHFFTGNHDIWVFDYLSSETGVIIHRNPLEIKISGKKFFLAHGDGLGPFDKKFKVLKRIFTNKLAQSLFKILHPDAGIYIAHKWSHKSRYSHSKVKFLGSDREWLVLFAKSLLKKQKFDYMIFGHRHFPHEFEIQNNCRFINLGDWISHFTYGVFDGTHFQLKSYVDSEKRFIIKE